MKKLSDLKIKIFADGADLKGMLSLNREDYVSGFTTNPSLMKKGGVTDYKVFAKEVLSQIKDKPVSFEVFADDLETMYKEAKVLGDLAENVYVKIPVTNSKGEYTTPIIERLSNENVKLNITAIFTANQVKKVIAALNPEVKSIISIFSGRIADAGEDPVKNMQEALEICKVNPSAEVLWASCREFYNIIEADKLGCHIITVPNSILAKSKNYGKDLEEYSLETVKGFAEDARSLGFSIL